MSPGWARSTASSSEQHAAVRQYAAHADRLVEPDRGRVLGPDEQADDRNMSEQEPAEIGQATLPVTAAADLRVDPDLLELDRAGRPRRGLGLEEDPSALPPQPRASAVDLL